MDINDDEKLLEKQNDLIREATEFIKIFTSIITKKSEK